MSQSTRGDSGAGPSYHRLTVRAVREETAEARSFVLVPEGGETPLYRYTPGQFLTFRVPHHDGELIRSYSLSSAPCTDPDTAEATPKVLQHVGRNHGGDAGVFAAVLQDGRVNKGDPIFQT